MKNGVTGHLTIIQLLERFRAVGQVPAVLLIPVLALSCVIGCSSTGSDVESRSSDQLNSEEMSVSEPWFVDQSSSWGMEHRFQSGHDQFCRFPEIMGGGGAVLDFDGDGWWDVYLIQAGGWQPTDPSHSRNVLLRNDGQGRLVDLSGASEADDAGYGMGVAVGDFDGDGWADLYITNVGPNVLLRNNGDGTFEDVTQTAGVGDPGWGTSVAWLDFDGDGWLDLYVCNYLHWYLQHDQRCYHPTGLDDYCGPQSYNDPQHDVLYRNNGDGTFTDWTMKSGIGASKGNGLGIVVADFNQDGSPDIFVANDMTPNLLWINDRNGSFSNHASRYGCAIDRDGIAKAGMGTCVGDVTGNGLLDLIVVNLDGQSDTFFENMGEYFIDRSASRLGMSSLPFTRFGVGLHDFNRDGLLDLFLACGRVMLPEGPPTTSDPYSESNLFFEGTLDGRFRKLADSEAGDVSQIATSRAAIFCDLSNDGNLEVIVINKDQRAQILTVAREFPGNWVGFRVLNSDGRDAVGAVVRLKTNPGLLLRRDVNPHYSYLASNDPRVLFGLADTSRLETVEVTWPDGTTTTFGPFDANAYYVLRRVESSSHAN